MKAVGNVDKAIYFAWGLVGWLIVQSLYSSIAVKFELPTLAYISIPINVISIMVIFWRKNRWIGTGSGTALIINGVALIYMGVHGVINDEAFYAWFILFPPFVLFFNDWLFRL